MEMNIEEFSLLPQKKKSWHVAKLYLNKCTIQGFIVNGKPNTDFFRIQNWLNHHEEGNLTLLFRYLTHIEDKEICTLSVLFDKAMNLSSKVSMNVNTAQTAKQYERKSVEEWLNG